MAQPAAASAVIPSATELHCSLSFDSFKRNNLVYIDDNTLLVTAGNTVQFINVPTGEISYLQGRDGGGVGAVCVHPSRQFFAVAEKGNFPGIYIYEYPSLNLVKTLPGGTEKAYSNICWDRDGEKLASVGSAPDFMLTLWNWQEERVILRSKAFGQDVFRITFSPAAEGQLTSSGTGHIKFWTMARTFTGLKLQGLIGKFGKVEISDIAGFAELPDGKVLSGSENGNLLLWDGNLIKCEIAMDGANTCHDGMIENVILEGNSFVTAGHDGYIKYWSFEAIDGADISEESPVFHIKPLLEIPVGEGVSIRGITRGVDHWIVQDSNGGLYRVKMAWPEGSPTTGAPEKFTCDRLFIFHSGAIVGADTAPNDHVVATAGADGTIRLYDYESKKMIFMRKHSAGASFLSWAPINVDGDCRTVIVGFQDGVVRVFKRCSEAFELSKVFKPHTKAITSISYSSDGLRVATCSEDGTIFFLNVLDGYTPIGFIRLPSVPVRLQWKSDDSTLLVCLRDCSVLEMPAPVTANIDSSATYEFTLPSKKYMYIGAPKPVDPPKEDKKSQDDAPVNPEDQAPEQELDEAAAKEKAEAEAAAAKQREEEALAALPHALVYGMYTNNDQLVISMDREQSVFLYSNHAWENPLYTVAPEYPVKALSVHSGPARSISYSRSGKYLLIGADDGGVSMRPADALDTVFLTSMHDGSYGRVRSACTSFDDSYLITAAEDGCLFVHRVTGETTQRPSAIALPIEAFDCEDITDANYYSIEEAKQKADQDAKERAANAKKVNVRTRIEELRAEFQELLKKNVAMDERSRLDRQEFELDPELTRELQREAEEKVEIAQKELGFYSAKCDLELSKVKNYFLDCLEVEHIVLKSFKSGRQVSTFVTPFLSDVLQQRIEMVHSLIAQEEAVRRAMESRQYQQDGYNGGDEHDDLDQDLDQQQQDQQQQAGRDSSASLNNTQTSESAAHHAANSALNKAEARKAKRAERAKLLDELMGRQPDDKYEDPRDVAAIEFAEKHMGDFKLKMDDDYVVPETQRVNAEKKLREMVLLEESIHILKMDFNERFLALRDLKRRIIENIRRDNVRIKEINDQLAVKEPALQPELDGSEFPEQREVMDQETLLKFERQLKRDEARRAAEAKAKSAGGFGGFGGGGGGNAEADEAEEKEREAAEAAKKHQANPSDDEPLARKQSMKIRKDLSAKDKYEQERLARVSAISQSDFEKELQRRQQEKLNFEKSRLKRKIEKTLETFDEALDELRREKFKLEADLKNTDMRLLLLFRELTLLKDFEKRDISLAKRLEEKRIEKADVVMKLAGCQEKLGQRKVEIERLLARERQLMSDFQTAVGDNPPYQDQLLKIFKRKVKRMKKREDAEGGDDDDDEDEEEEEEDDDDGGDEDDEDMEEEEEEEGPPQGCPQRVFDTIVALRERRLDQEEALAEFQKNIEALKKENEALIKKEKTVDQSLKTVEKDIQTFQNEKQRKLNELEMVVMLKMHQIEFLPSSSQDSSASASAVPSTGLTSSPSILRMMPSESQTGPIIEGVVFTNAGLAALRNRIHELIQEKSNLRRNQKELRKQHVLLSRARREKTDNVSTLVAKVQEMQLLKFGQEVDFEALENAAVDRMVEELKEELRQKEAVAAAAVRKWEDQLASSKQQLSVITDENTHLLQRLADLTQRQQKLEGDLNRAQVTMLDRVSSNTQHADREERERLRELVIIQAREIEALKAEINILHTKSGHIFAPVKQ